MFRRLSLGRPGLCVCLIGLGLLAGACDNTLDTDAVTPCGSTDDCAKGAHCLGGLCVKEGQVADVLQSVEATVGCPTGACDDGNPCTSDTCDPAKGCSHLDKEGACDDGDPCTEGDVCKSGTCTPGSAKGCDDGDPCTSDACDSSQGCVHSPVAVPCDDGDKCTTGDACQDGKCKGGAAANCDDDDVCTDDGCDKAVGCTHTHNTAKCDDGDLCTKDEVCAAGKCGGGVKLDCECKVNADCAKFDDGDKCTGLVVCGLVGLPGKCTVDVSTIPVCDTSHDTACMVTACAKSVGSCAPQPVVDGKGCDDGNACTAQEACKGGLCAGGAAVACDDKQPCTLDTCDGTIGCQFSGAPLEGKACDADGSLCTTGDVCTGGECKAGPALKCDDGQPCTDDSCDKAKGCVHAANTASCDDGDVCTAGEACAGGACAGGKAVVCDDKNVCTLDVCTPGKGCVSSAAPLDGKPCDADGDACTTADTCDAGKCKPGAAANCADDNACTTDSCDKAKGCTHAAKEGSCEDGDQCTTGDVCGAGVCKPGKARDCDDGNACTADSCDKLQGCQHKEAQGPCDDGDACTATSTCAAGVCKGGAAKDCGDNNPCTADLCDAKTGQCVPKPVADGSVCTGSAVCAQGNCVNLKSGRVRIPAGAFWMGCNPALDNACQPDEKPQHKVVLPSYWVDRTEVTSSRYEACRSAGHCPPVAPYDPAHPKKPAVALTRAKADAVCAWSGGALLTEQQWEKAARGGCELYGQTQCQTLMPRFPWGMTGPTCKLAHMAGCAAANVTADVDAHPAGASPYGVLGMAGNVWEWTTTCYLADGYSKSLEENQKCDPSQDHVAMRGGSYFEGGGGLRGGVRGHAAGSLVSANIGARCGYPEATNCDDGDPCTEDALDTKTGACKYTAVACDDDNACTVDTCASDLGGCRFQQVDNGSACEEGGMCEDGNCTLTLGFHDKRVRVPAGDFWMGHRGPQYFAGDDAKPYRKVTLAAYWIDIYEATYRAQQACIDSGACKDLAAKLVCHPDLPCGKSFPDNGKYHAAAAIKHGEAAKVCATRGGALPTEAQWEKAASGGCERYDRMDCKSATRKFPWGDVFDAKKAWLGKAMTANVFAFGGALRTDRSPYGVYDMMGNLSEWVADWYKDNYYNTAPATDPTGPDSGTQRVVRGGNWQDSDQGSASSTANWPSNSRRNARGEQADIRIGFRCAWPVGCGRCDDGNVCTTGSCTGGKCSHKPLADGTVCLVGGKCTGGVCVNTKPLGTKDHPAASCKAILDQAPASPDGAYWLMPHAADKPFEVYCDMTTAGGGWTLVGRTGGKAHDKDGGVLDGHDWKRWGDLQYFGDVTKLDQNEALGPAYHTVRFSDFMLQGTHDTAKRLAWRVGQAQDSLHTVFVSGVTILHSAVLMGGFETLNYKPGCLVGAVPSSEAPHAYGFNLGSEKQLGTTGSGELFNGVQKGWCTALAGWGRDVIEPDLSGGGLGADCSNRSHQMARHHWGFGDACHKSDWGAVPKNVDAFYGHAFYVR